MLPAASLGVAVPPPPPLPHLQLGLGERRCRPTKRGRKGGREGAFVRRPSRRRKGRVGANWAGEGLGERYSR